MIKNTLGERMITISLGGVKNTVDPKPIQRCNAKNTIRICLRQGKVTQLWFA